MCTREGLQKLEVTLEIKVFSFCALDSRIDHSLFKVEHLDFDLKPVIYHTVQLALLANKVDDLCIKVFINNKLVKFETS